jgi:hypothetical protein
MTHSAALFRAHNVQILDYPIAGAIASALSVCDEAVVVTQPSADDTLSILCDQQERWGRRVRIILHKWTYNRQWQEDVWNIGMLCTDAEWLMYHDADEAVLDPEPIRDLMANSEVNLIRFPFIHLYATANYEISFKLTHNTRLGRRSAGYRMRNWCTDEHPKRATCQMVFGPKELNAHIPRTDVGLVTTEVPILHYGWCRDAWALATSQSKLKAWYADGGGLEDGRIPDVEPYDFHLGEQLAAGRAKPYVGVHPGYMADWFDRHEAEWEGIEVNV